MKIAIGNSLSDCASFEDDMNGDDQDDEHAQFGKLGEDDKHGWVVGTISKIVQQCIDRYWQNQRKLDELTQLGWGDAANNFREKDKKYGKTELKFLATFNSEIKKVAAASAPTTFRELIESLDIVPGEMQLLQGTSRP